MPNRVLRDWTDSERVNAVSVHAECLFGRLIMKADDYARYHADPRLLSAYLYPLKDVRTPDIARWLDELEKAGLIVRYENSRRRYLEIVNFGQRLRARAPSKFPAPPTNGCHVDSNASTTCQQRVNNVTASCSSCRRGDEKREARSEKSMCRSNMQAVIRTASTSVERDTPDEAAAAAEDGLKKYQKRPTTTAQVMEIADRSGAICTEAQADAYLLSRQASGWMIGGNSPIRSVAADLKRFLMRWAENDAEHGRSGGSASDVGIDRAGREARKRREEELEKAARDWR